MLLSDSLTQSHISGHPTDLAPFIGRSDDLAEVTGLLVTSACRLLTLFGAAGIGKTRLAIQAAVQMRDRFPHGVYLVRLPTVQSHNFLISVLADALDITLPSRVDSTDYLIDYLQDKELLLILDQGKQLLGGIPLLSKILQAAPGVKLLATSRAMLSLPDEWVYQVHGLPFAKNIRAANRLRCEAAQLFAACARQFRHDFEPTSEALGVARICHLVEGAPLAIELAATLTKTMRCAAIADAIEHAIEELSAIGRQDSTRAMFQVVWQSLAETEREAFKCLAVFRASFPVAAVEAIYRDLGIAVREVELEADRHKPQSSYHQSLATLAERSLLQVEPDGRYRLHELLRQYAAEYLEQAPDEMALVYDAHCTYYTEFVAAHWSGLDGSLQPEAVAALRANFEDIRAAWRWAAAWAKEEKLSRAVRALSLYYQIIGCYQEGVDAIAQALRGLEQLSSSAQADKTIALLLLNQGRLYMRLRWLDEAKEAVTQSREIYERSQPQPQRERSAEAD
ncbi:MAG: NB-ARC domain-containing protein [Chloroflexales bacterium]|nr:NB-ARC domain-containing protein [Chloroflexales bacterium]